MKRRFAQKHVDYLKSDTVQGTNIHPSLLHKEDLLLLAVEKGRGEEGSFAVTSWRAAWAVFSTAHILTGVLTLALIPAPLRNSWQAGHTEVTGLKILGCSPGNDPNQLFVVWFVTFT